VRKRREKDEVSVLRTGVGVHDVVYIRATVRNVRSCF